MITAVMMKADTRPARRGSNVGESWDVAASPPTLSWEGLSGCPLAWAEGLLCEEVVVVVWRATLGVTTCFSVEAFVTIGDTIFGGCWVEAVLDVELDWVVGLVVVVVVAVEVGVGAAFGCSGVGAELTEMFGDDVTESGGCNAASVDAFVCGVAGGEVAAELVLAVSAGPVVEEVRVL